MSKEEADRYVVYTYLLVGDILSLYRGKAIKDCWQTSITGGLSKDGDLGNPGISGLEHRGWFICLAFFFIGT